jgi:hypothetical protein
MNKSEFWVSVASILLYATMGICSFCQYRKFKSLGQTKRVQWKLLFFGILSLSSIFELPLWVDCALTLGPDSCAVNDASYPVLLCLHFISLCGFAFCLGITTLLWSDIFTNNEDMPLFNFYAPDFGRKIFYITYSGYFSLQLAVMFAIIVWMNPHEPDIFLENNRMYAFYVCAEPAFMLIFACGCLFSGIRLQMYVLSVKL